MTIVRVRASVRKARILAVLLALAGGFVHPRTADADQRLVQAAARGDVATVRRLLRERVDVNA